MKWAEYVLQHCMHACNKHTSTRVSTHALRRETINTRRQRSNERCNDISSFSLFTFLTLAPVMCVVFLFTSSGCCYRERHSLTGGKFTERVLPGPCTVHRDQILPRCIMCVCVCGYNSIFTTTGAAAATAFILQSPGPLRALWVLSLWAQAHPSTCRENKSRASFYSTPGENTKKKCFEELV